MKNLNDDGWGLSSSIDFYNCDFNLMTNRDHIIQTTTELCDLIKMKRFGECHVVHFGENEKVAGFSMFQLIETSNITAHFANASKTIYFDIFSCKNYDPSSVALFLLEKFRGNNYRINVLKRY